jgi:8-oxo-dGTP pyrophosphatase MutT (NUDIX family)
MILVQDVTGLLHAFSAGEDGEAEKSRELVLALLTHSPEQFSRAVYTPGHITCTGVVLSPERDAVLLVHHRRLDRWLLPGGHVEIEDACISGVARREVIEETGAQLSNAPAMLVGVDVHPIPSNKREPLHLHHDLIFAFDANSEQFHCSEESRAVVWCRLNHFDQYDLPGSIRRSVTRATQK